MKKIIYLTILSLIPFVTILSQNKNVRTAGGQDAEIAYNKGIQNFMSQDYAGAISELTIAISHKPDFGKAYYNRGVIRNEIKDFD